MALSVIFVCIILCNGVHTACQNDNQNADIVKFLLGMFIPQCENGVYAAEQCSGFDECWCVTEDGQEIPNTRINASMQGSSKKDCREERQKFMNSNSEMWIQLDASSSNCSDDENCANEQSIQSQSDVGIRQVRQANAPVTVVGLNTTGQETGDAAGGAGNLNSSAVEGQGGSPAMVNATTDEIASTSTESSTSTNLTINAEELNATTAISVSPEFTSSATMTENAENATENENMESMMVTQPATSAASGASVMVSEIEAATVTEVTMESETVADAVANQTEQPIEMTTFEMGLNETMQEISSTVAPAINENASGLSTEPSITADNAASVNDSCGANTVYSLCATTCPNGCDQPEEELCALTTCSAGCVCAPGYLRLRSNDINSQCVKPSVCGQAVAQPSSAGRCEDPNANWTTCGTPCEETCQFRPTDCPSHCAVGCFCNEGYVKESNTSSTCISRDQCVQAPQPYQQQCPDPNAVLSNCGTACEETCNFKPTNCTLPCVSGCFCKDAFVKESRVANARCVPRDQCKMGQVWARDDTQCPDPNSSWLECGTSCPETCRLRKAYCTTQCVAGCFCNEGFVKRSRSPTAKCVPPSACKRRTLIWS